MKVVTGDCESFSVSGRICITKVLGEFFPLEFAD